LEAVVEEARDSRAKTPQLANLQEAVAAVAGVGLVQQVGSLIQLVRLSQRKPDSHRLEGRAATRRRATQLPRVRVDRVAKLVKQVTAAHGPEEVQPVPLWKEVGRVCGYIKE
jgi:hypothetical protein